MPDYLVRVKVEKVYEVYVSAPDDTAIFEYQEKPHRLSQWNVIRLEDVESIGELVETNKEVMELIEGK